MKSKRLFICIIVGIYGLTGSHTQAQEHKVKDKKYLTLDKTEIHAQVGYVSVPENRLNPESRYIKVKFIRLKSLSENPTAPLIYLEGGGSSSTWQAEKPRYLTDWIPLLEVSDVILVDQRGTTDRKLTWIWKGDYPENFFVTESAAEEHYQSICKMALESFSEKGIDVLGYNVVESSKDIEEIRALLGIEKYSIFGFSYGSHLGMALIGLYEKNIVNAVFVATDGLEHSFNYPSLLDAHFQKISAMVAKDSILGEEMRDLEGLLQKVMTKLGQNPVEVEIKNPLTKKSMSVKVGSFGLSLILRLDIDDASDIPIIPRLLYSIDQGDYSLLQWFVQKRIVLAFAVPGNGINQGISAGSSAKRWKKIEEQAAESPFGNVVNFPFSAAKKVWPESQLVIDMHEPFKTDIRTLFISGDLDCRTPVSQTEEIKLGFTNATHLIVKNAGHEQAMWNVKIFDQAIPQFLRGDGVSDVKTVLKSIKFISNTEKNKDLHPSLSDN